MGPMRNTGVSRESCTSSPGASATRRCCLRGTGGPSRWTRRRLPWCGTGDGSRRDRTLLASAPHDGRQPSGIVLRRLPAVDRRLVAVGRHDPPRTADVRRRRGPARVRFGLREHDPRGAGGSRRHQAGSAQRRVRVDGAILRRLDLRPLGRMASDGVSGGRAPGFGLVALERAGRPPDRRRCDGRRAASRCVVPDVLQRQPAQLLSLGGGRIARPGHPVRSDGAGRECAGRIAEVDGHQRGLRPPPFARGRRPRRSPGRRGRRGSHPRARGHLGGQRSRPDDAGGVSQGLSAARRRAVRRSAWARKTTAVDRAQGADTDDLQSRAGGSPVVEARLRDRLSRGHERGGPDPAVPARGVHHRTARRRTGQSSLLRAGHQGHRVHADVGIAAVLLADLGEAGAGARHAVLPDGRRRRASRGRSTSTSASCRRSSAWSMPRPLRSRPPCGRQWLPRVSAERRDRPGIGRRMAAARRAE